MTNLRAATVTTATVRSNPGFGLKSLTLPPDLRQALNVIVVTISLLASVSFGGMLLDSTHVYSAWQCMLCLTSPMAITALIFWIIGRLI
jgi:hypothetical protein